MAAPTNLPQLSHIDPTSPHTFTFNEPPLQPPFMAAPTPDAEQIAAQNHDRSTEPALPAAPPQTFPNVAAIPIADLAFPHEQAEVAPQSDEQSNERVSADSGRRSGSDGGGESEHEESEEEDDSQPPPNDWQPIEEDKSAPCEDELAYINQRGGEHSALDYTYWEKKTFFDLEDPEIYPIASGRIDWTVEHFNGTKENPNTECIMRSSIIRVGDYDWRIKFYPKGNNSDYLSVYLECVTMQSEDFQEYNDLPHGPFPTHADRDGLKRLATSAVQLGVVMYNPAEPRVYESQIDAHQFTKKVADYGWTRFTRHSRREFPYRMHCQRQALLRDDKLAFSAYIRIVHDPTNCMWAHGSDLYNDSVALTGLRPFSSLTPMYGAKLPLLHFAPFRDFISKLNSGKIVYWLQCLLWKMMSRTRSAYYGRPWNEASLDPVAWLRHTSTELRGYADPTEVNELIGSFEPHNGAAVGASRLMTKAMGSIQGAIDIHPTPIATPALLTLELEREEFHRKERKWNKITNYVEMQNRIIVKGTPYVLYAFSTHCGDLTSNKFNFYIRPQGPETLWYAYTSGSVTGMTSKQAVDAHSGVDPDVRPQKEAKRSSRHRRLFRYEDLDEVAHVVYYVRDDYRHCLTDPRPPESWDVPENVKNFTPPKHIHDRPDALLQTAWGAGTMDAELEHALNAQMARARQASIDESTEGATPNAWITDGEDIVMSDAEADEAPKEDAVSPEHIRTGCLIEHLGREYYKGSLVGERYHGEGHLISMNGDEYIGSFIASEKSGYGKMIYARSGNIYEGQWLADQHHGQGKLTEAKSQNVFEGGWKEGKKSGQFVLKGTMTDEDKGCCSICYDREISTAFVDCGHVLACRECANKIENCPVCRRPVRMRVELYGVKMIFE